MILVIGGAGQGKLAAALRNTGYAQTDVTHMPGADFPKRKSRTTQTRTLKAKARKKIKAKKKPQPKTKRNNL